MIVTYYHVTIYGPDLLSKEASDVYRFIAVAQTSNCTLPHSVNAYLKDSCNIGHALLTSARQSKAIDEVTTCCVGTD